MMLVTMNQFIQIQSCLWVNVNKIKLIGRWPDVSKIRVFIEDDCEQDTGYDVHEPYRDEVLKLCQQTNSPSAPSTTSPE